MLHITDITNLSRNYSRKINIFSPIRTNKTAFRSLKNMTRLTLRLLKSMKLLFTFTISFLLSISTGQTFAGEAGSKTEGLTNMASISARSVKLEKQIEQALQSKPDSYNPRTEHLLPDGSPRYTNRLILQDSPYLLQHAHNPVDWYAWGEEAFTVAKRENKPIFLSIGYSTCHWCHVMEKESFENPEIADFLNRGFISIKVDRERRPDVDKTYMTAVQLMTRGGGWPMSSFLTPDGKPFFGGTYYPPQVFQGLIAKIDSLWKSQNSSLIEQAERVAQAVEQLNHTQSEAVALSSKAIPGAVREALAIHDEFQGGFGSAPKFPREPLLFLLLDEAERNNSVETLDAIHTTLDAMGRGGIYDQVGGGFHRYSTDNEWLVPHFEKMLYNQAHLTRIYLRAWRLTGNPSYQRITRQTLDYVLRNMTSPAGAFYSATDADSEDEEGVFFLWSQQQIRDVLSEPDARLAIALFGISKNGNFEGSNILHLPVSLEEFAAQQQTSMQQLLTRVDRIREQLYQAREKREHPLRDEKIITAWNGMMISTLSEAGMLLNEPRYTNAAILAAEFIWKRNRNNSGELWRVHLEGSSSISAKQQDYAYFAEGLLQVYDATGSDVWLKRAKEITNAMLEQFWDEHNGGFFMSGEQQQLTKMGRPRDGGSDNAMPSGNSVALRVLQKLEVRTDNLEYGKKANATLTSFAGHINENPRSFGYMLTAASEMQSGELGALRYVARGGVKVKASQLEPDRITVDISIPEGWHINSNKPLQEGLIPTRLSVNKDARGWRSGNIEYPKATMATLGFQSEALSLYQGDIQILLKVNSVEDSTRILPLQLGIQACNDRICLPPENIALHLPMTP